MLRISIATALLTAVIPYSVAAQEPPASPDQVLIDRIEAMEAQMSALRSEIETLKAELRASSRDPSGLAAAEEGKAAPETREAASPLPRSQTKQTVGVEIGNGLRLVPYGTVFFNAFGNTSGTNNADVPLWATASDQSNSGMSLRQTRFGARIEGGRIGNAAVTGVIEADFYGGFPAVGVGENFGVVRLRVAKFKLDWEKTSLTVGQDWIVFAPLSPTSIAAAAIPQFAASGNLWARLPQARVERKFGNGRFLFQGAVLAPTSGDFPSGSESPFLLQPGAASRSGMPSLETRLAFTGKNWFGSGRAGTAAVSGHFGRSSFNGSDIGSYAIAADWNIPLAKRIGVSGEAFFGENLGGLQGGIFQGYNPDHGIEADGSVAASVRAIRSRGGWVQVSYTPPLLKDRMTFYGSAGIDDPKNADLFSMTPKNWRMRNLTYAFNVIFKPIPQLSIGGEFRRFETDYFLTGKRRAEHLNLGAAYSF
jgi:hypothetical protein